MLMLSIIVCASIWLLILVHHINRRGFLILLIWLLIGPVATNLIQGDSNPFFRIKAVEDDWELNQSQIFEKRPEITLRGLLEPTRVFFAIFLGVYLLNAILKAKPHVSLDGIEVWMVIFSLILLVNVLLNQPNRVLMALRLRGEPFILPFIGYYLSRRLIINEVRFYQLSQVLIYVGFYIILICIVERLMHSRIHHRLAGPFHGDPAVHVVMGLVFVMALSNFFHKNTFLHEPPAFPRSVQRVVLYLAPVIIFLTWARAHWVAFFLALAVIVFLARRLMNRAQKACTIGLVLLLATTMVISVQGTGLGEMIGERVNRVGNFYTRVGAWQILMQDSLRHPILGGGLRSAHVILREERTEFRDVISETNPHNSFLTILFEMGGAGLLAYLAVVGSIIYMGLRLYQHGSNLRDRWRGVAVIAIMVSYLIPAMFMNSLHLAKLHQVYVYVFFGSIAGLYGRRFS